MVITITKTDNGKNVLFFKSFIFKIRNAMLPISNLLKNNYFISYFKFHFVV